MPIFNAAMNTALEAVALSVRAGGTVAQAVVDGLNAFRKSEFYKGLSKEGQEGIENEVASELERVVKESKFKDKVIEKQKEVVSFLDSLKESRDKNKRGNYKTSKAAARNAETISDPDKKQAKIDKAALMALSGIALNTDEFTVAVIKVKGLSEKNIKSLMETLQESIDKSFELLGWVQYTLTSRAIGGNDYTPGGEENTMIDFGEVESDTPFRTMT